MSEAISTRLYGLLPELYRWRDEQQGKPLQALLAILEREFHTLEVDTEAMYDNWFIQTCDNWVVPYLADLVGIRDQIAQVDYLPFTQRRRVANTLAYRRRKGTVAVLEQVLWDVTNWHVRAVEFYQRLVMTQHLQHLQGDQVTAVSLKDMAALAALESPFNTLSRSSDIRSAAPSIAKVETAADQPAPNPAPQTSKGKFNPHNLGLFFWRLRPYPVNRGVPKQKEGTPFFTFSPTGHDTQLFNQPQSFLALEQRATAINMPILLTRAELAADLSNLRRQFKDRPLDQLPLSSTYYGADRSFTITDIHETFLFGLPSELDILTELNKGVLANKLREKFADEGVLLAQNSSVRPIVTDKSWQIEDVSLGKSYRLITAGNALRVSRNREQILPFHILSVDLSEWPSVETLRAYYVDDPPLFSIDANELDKIGLTDKLRAQFYEKGVTLSNKAKLTMEAPGSKWIIVDAGRKYSIKSENHTLQVHDETHADLVAVDPELGRIAFLNSQSAPGAQAIRVDYTYGFSGDVGGGPYPRHFAVDSTWQNYCEILVAVGCQDSNVEGVSEKSSVLVASSVELALTLWNRYCEKINEEGNDKPRALIRILDNGIYATGKSADRVAENSDKAKTMIQLPAGAELAIVAEDGVQPTLNAQLAIDFPQPPPRTLARGIAAAALAQADSVVEDAPIVDRKLLLSGLCIVGGLVVGKVAKATINALDLVLEHCSLLEGGIGVELEAENAPALALSILRSIVGPLRVPANVAGLRITESIVDSQLAAQTADASEQNEYALAGPVNAGTNVNPGPAATLERCTIFGKVALGGMLQADAVLFTDLVTVNQPDKDAEGMLRYCYVPAGSRVPAGDYCLYEDAKPDRGATCLDKISRPVFSSRRYGRPDYAQLSKLSADEILAGVGKVAEIGVFYHLYQPQREANIQTILEEYLPLGVDAGVFHVT